MDLETTLRKTLMKLTLISLMAFSLQAPAAVWTAQKGLCMTSPFPSTTFAFNTSGVGDQAKINVSVVHHNGLEYAAFWDSAIVSSDLKILAEKSKVILDLETEFNTSWLAKNCQQTGPKKVSCVGAGDKITSKSKVIVPWAFYLAVQTDSSFTGDYSYIQMTLLFYIDGQKYMYVAKYPESDCEFELGIF